MKIKISQLAEGHHTFTASENPRFFGLNDAERFDHNVDITVEIDKRGRTLFVHQFVHTIANFPCDRCLDLFSMPLDADFRVIFTSDPGLANLDEDIRFLGHDQAEIDISEDIRETILLSIPTKWLCKSECKGLCPHCGVNLNFESCTCQGPQIDPRWEALKKLME